MKSDQTCMDADHSETAVAQKAIVQPSFDGQGYPTEETLLTIQHWTHTDHAGLFDFVKAAWRSDMGKFYEAWRGHDGERSWLMLCMSTGGWSGNESIIEALGRNTMFWSLRWEMSKRGGYYEFSMRKIG